MISFYQNEKADVYCDGTRACVTNTNVNEYEFLRSVKYHVRLVTIRVDFNNIPNMIVVRTHIDFGNNNTSIKNEHSILLP